MVSWWLSFTGHYTSDDATFGPAAIPNLDVDLSVDWSHKRKSIFQYCSPRYFYLCLPINFMEKILDTNAFITKQDYIMKAQERCRSSSWSRMTMPRGSKSDMVTWKEREASRHTVLGRGPVSWLTTWEKINLPILLSTLLYLCLPIDFVEKINAIKTEREYLMNHDSAGGMPPRGSR